MFRAPIENGQTKCDIIKTHPRVFKYKDTWSQNFLMEWRTLNITNIKNTTFKNRQNLSVHESRMTNNETFSNLISDLP